MFRITATVFRFAQRQIQHVQEYGTQTLYHKVGRLMRIIIRSAFLVLLLPFILPTLLIVRALRPVLVIRFGRLRGDRLGHLVLEPEFYLCERDVGLHDIRTRDFFYFSQPTCNRQLKRMLKRLVSVSILVRPLDEINRLLPGWETHAVPLYTSKHEDVHELFDRVSPHFFFTKKEEATGAIARRNLGIPDKASFVCFIARDSSYLANRFTQDLSYHDYRDSNIHNYVAAAEALVNRGCYAIRMGAIVTQALNTTNPHIIDYAVKDRGDFLDVYFFAKCRFLISSNSGGCAVAMAFRRPIAFVNTAPFLALDGTVPLKNILFIPKKYWLSDQKRFMTFGEIMKSGADQFYISREYKTLGIELVENSPEEIRALAIEMDERLKGVWQDTEEDLMLRNRLMSIVRTRKSSDVRLPLMGANFLRNNRHLLD